MTMPPSDTITVLRCNSALRLAKLIKADGSAVDYDSPRTFSACEHTVTGLDGLAKGLRTLQGQPQQCVVRGSLVNGPAAKGIRRLLHRDPETGDEPTLREAPRRWIALDLDGLARPEGISAADLLGCAHAVIPALPVGFHAASCIVQATAGHGRKPGSRLRLWFWLDRAVGRTELEVWFAGHSVDAVSFRAAQVTYTAAPVFEEGITDHLPARLALLPGAAEVPVPPSEALQLPPRPRRATFEIPAAKAAEWAENAFRRGVAAVATAPTDSRHVTCVKVAFNLACLCHEGRLYESHVRSALGAALEHSGKDAEEAFKVFDWAMGQASGAAA